MRRRRRTKEGQEKRERKNRRPILKKLCAAVLRLFRGQHSEKMKRCARGNWDPREGQQPFRPKPNRVGECTTTLIGAVLFLSWKDRLSFRTWMPVKLATMRLPFLWESKRPSGVLKRTYIIVRVECILCVIFFSVASLVVEI